MKFPFANAALRALSRAVLLAFLLAGSMAQAGDLRLVMLEQNGCMWCARWDAEIGPIYPKTAQSSAAPLEKLNLHDPLPEGVALARPASYTPTFVLLDDGHEVGRIEGYPGEDFFWALLDELLTTAGQPVTN